jgi:hypothetical protein
MSVNTQMERVGRQARFVRHWRGLMFVPKRGLFCLVLIVIALIGTQPSRVASSGPAAASATSKSLCCDEMAGASTASQKSGLSACKPAL